MYIPADFLTKSLGKEIMSVVNGYKIPSLAAIQSMVFEDGALLGLVNNLYQFGRLAADKTNRNLAANIPSYNLAWLQPGGAQEIGVPFLFW